MGSPASLIPVELTMQKIEETILGITHHGLMFFKRYVDECFAIITNSHIYSFLTFINIVNENLQFTCEKKERRKQVQRYSR